MRQGGGQLKGLAGLFGCISALIVFTQTGHAATHRKPVHSVIRHPAPAHHAVIRHVAVRRVVERRPVEHAVVRHLPVRHAPIHRVASRRHDYRHGYVAHPVAHRYIHHASYLWCVPYARDISHIDLKGDAFLWWAEAAGRYARGNRPQDGAVLNFRSSPRIPLGHVAVVERVVSSREVLVDQANWIPDRVSHDVPVIDVSANNDWSRVQVALGNGRFGMTYPTYGFIYNQRPGSAVYASANGIEVAEAPVVHKIRLAAPNRTLR